jgi:hypothetical protein
MKARTVAEMTEQAQRWRKDSLETNNLASLTAEWIVTASEARALRDELGQYQNTDPTATPRFMGMPLKVIPDE